MPAKHHSLKDCFLPATKERARAMNSRWFYTGKPCRNGHLARRSVERGTCCECAKVAAAKRRLALDFKAAMAESNSTL